MANIARDGSFNSIFTPKRKTTENECQQYGAKKRIISIHQKCGGNIIKQDQCILCEKCMKYFCDCIPK